MVRTCLNTSIFLLPWKMFAVEQGSRSTGIYCLCYSKGEGGNDILGESFGELIWMLQLSPEITGHRALLVC